MTDLDVQIKLAAQDLASPPIGRAVGSLNDLGRAASDAHGALSRITNAAASGFGFAAGLAGFQGLSQVVGGVGESVIGLNATLEQNKVAFTTMLGSADAADKMLKQLADFAAATPFEFKDLTEGTKRMLAFGFSAEQVMPMLKSIGDAAAGLGLSGAEGINRIGLALGQMQAKTKVSAEEMLQLTEVGVPAWDILAKGIGHTTAETQKLAEKGLIPASLAIDLLTQGMEQRFPDMMTKQSQTFNGLMSTLHDTVTMGLAQMGESIFNVSKDALGSLVELLSAPEVKEASQQVGKAIGDGISFAVGMFKTLIEAVGPVTDAVKAVAEAFTSDADAMKKVLPVIRKLFGDTVADGIQPFIEGFTRAIPAIKEFADRFGTYLSGLGEAVKKIFRGDINGAIETFLNAFGPWGAYLSTKLGEWARMFVDWIGPLVPPMLSKLGELLGRLGQWIVTTAAPEIATQLGQWGAAFVSWVTPYIPPMLASLANLLLQLGAWVVQTALPAIRDQVLQWGAAFIEWIGPRIGPMIQQLAGLGAALLQWVAQTALPAIKDQLLTWGRAFVEWVGPEIPEVIGALGSLLLQVGAWIKGSTPALAEQLGEWAGAFTRWVIDAAQALPGQLGQITDAIRGWVSGSGESSLREQGGNMGKAILEGIKEAFTSGVPGIIDGLADLVKKAIESFVRGFGRGLAPQPAQPAFSAVGLRLQTDYGTAPMPSTGVGGFSPFDAIFRKYAGDLASDPRFIAIVAAGTKAESNWNPNSRSGDSGHSFGLFQMHDQGAGAGLGDLRLDPDFASSIMVPKYAAAYRQSQGLGLSDPELASLVAALAERPLDYDKPNSAARRGYANAYREVAGGGGGAQMFNASFTPGMADISDDQQRQWEQALNGSKASQDPTSGFRRQLEKLARSVQDQLTKIGENVGEQWNAAVADAGSQIQQVQQQAARQISQIQQNRQLELETRARRDALEASQEAARMQFETQQAARELAYRTTQEDKNTGRSRGREDTERQFQFGVSAQQVAHTRGLEDSDLQQSRVIEDQRSVQAQQLQLSRLERDMNKDMAKAKTDDERKQIQQRYADRREEMTQSIADAKEELAIRRQQEDEDRKRRRDEDDGERQYQFDQEAKAVAHRRELDDQDIQYKRQQDAENDAFQKEMQAAANTFRKGQEKEVRAFEDQLAEEAMAREIARINQEKDERIAAINEALKEKQAKILADAEKERQTLLKSFQERAADLKQEVTDKVPEATGDAQAKMVAFLAEIDAKVAEVTGRIAASAAASMANLPAAAAQASADLEQPLQAIAGQFAVSDQAVEIFADKFGLKWEEARPLLAEIEAGYTQTFGNVVPGAIQVTDDAVEAFAALWGITWDEARAILEAGKNHADEVFGRSIPAAAKLTDDALKNTGQAHTDLLDPVGKVKEATGKLSEEGFGKMNKAQAELARDISTQIAAVLLQLRDGLTGDGAYSGNGLIKAVSDFHRELDELPRDITVNVHYNNSGAPSGSAGGGGGSSGGGGGGSGGGGGGGATPAPPGGYTPGFGPNGPTHPGQSGPGGIYNNPSTGQPYANGGILMEPVLGMGMFSGRRYSFAETGPEEWGGVGKVGKGGDVHLHLTVEGSIVGGTIEEFASKLAGEFRRLGRQNGGIRNVLGA